MGFRPGRCGLHALCNLAQACDSQPAACEWPTSSVACMVHHSGAVYPSIGSSASLRFAALRCAWPPVPARRSAHCHSGDSLQLLLGCDWGMGRSIFLDDVGRRSIVAEGHQRQLAAHEAVRAAQEGLYPWTGYAYLAARDR